MNPIIELIAKAEVDGDFSNLQAQVVKLHKDQILAAYNRGRASTMGVFMMTDEQFYTKYYGQD